MMSSEKQLLNRILEESKKLPRKVKLMEVCGTHTVNIFRSGIKSLLPENINIVSGPGCPVCVTPDYAIDNAIEVAKEGVTVLTFGDMVRVPGTHSSLEKTGNYKVFYSPYEILELHKDIERGVVLCVGFETTAPMLAWVIKRVKELGIKNLSFYVLHKLIPPALEALTYDSDIDGFILPGHVSTIIGARAYSFLKKPSVITGFETEQILRGLLVLIKMLQRGEESVVNAYAEVVRDEGNTQAVEMMYTVFEESDADWRGLGPIPRSGLQLKKEYEHLDAEKIYSFKRQGVIEQGMCRCGEVLKGKITPVECPLFGNGCTPENPKGACMVSAEGSCAAYYRWYNT